VEPPLAGVVIPAICELLVRELTRLTGTPSTCYFALWEGWGELAGSRSRVVGATVDDPVCDAEEALFAAWQHQVALLPRFRHPGRAYLVGMGRLASFPTCITSASASTPGQLSG